jgi:glycine oxidase
VRITVVGAGVVGCAVAHALAARGAAVDVLDGRGVGLGATRASAGMLAPQIEGHIPELRDLAVRSLSLYDEFISRVEQDSRRPVEYHRDGTIQLALDDAEAQQLADMSRALRAAAVQHELLDRAGVGRLEPNVTGEAVAGLVVPSHGHVRAGELTEALAAAAQARGARLTIASVHGVDAGGPSVRVATANGTFESDAVVVASGSWMIDSRPAPPPDMKPIRGQLVQVRSDTPAITRVVWSRDCYLVPWRDGTVFVGATAEDVGYDERCTVDGVRGLLNAAASAVPLLGRAQLEEVRVGLRPKGRGELPTVGRSQTMPGVFYAVGHYRNGVLLAPLTASLMADLVLEGRERPELALLAASRRG